MKLISVVIPTKNRQKLLKQIIPSYLKQKGLGELIIINDGSEDETSSYLRSLKKSNSKLIFFENKVSMGAPYSRNIGVSHSKYSLIYFGEDDLYLQDNTFSTLLLHMENTDADIISSRRISLFPNEREQDSVIRANSDHHPLINKFLVTTTCQINTKVDLASDLLDASMLVKTEILKNIPYDTFYKNNAYREETDFQLSCREKGYKLVFCPHSITFHLPKKINKGGNHSAHTLKYEWEVFKNDYYFINKHKRFLKEQFNLNPLNHFICFLGFRLIYRNLLPFLANVIGKYKPKIA